MIEPFEIQVSSEVLDDLRERLARSRIPDAIAHSGWEYGADASYIAELVAYWRKQYDWRAAERELNALAQYRAPVRNHRIHFIHQRGHGPDPIPLLLLHGWPGSPFEFRKLIGLLTNPGSDGRRSFTIVAPSLPGFCFSDQPQARGMNVAAIGDIAGELMTGVLGYDRFAVQGGDWGSGIATRIAETMPRNVIGLHLNMIAVAVAKSDHDAALTADEKIFLGDVERFRREEAGYQWIQSTRPQTLAFALNDSPVGLLAWMVEKFRAWSDCRGDIERRFSKQDLITSAMLYWVTGSIGSSMRLYYEARRYPWNPANRIEVPAAIAVFPGELMKPPRSWVEQVYDVRRWTVMRSGGHFAAMEEPELLANDIGAFFGEVVGEVARGG
ncbi:MAG: alpha/beta fold hydrolase [Candidatus Binataceae bacterium]|nr:alpha/beta fold hydrolase [Candidatus Binataceae bacterium]